MTMKFISDQGQIAYADDGTPTPDGWTEVSGIERRPPQDEAPTKGTVQSSNIPEWLTNALGSVGLQLRTPTIGSDAVIQGMQSAGMGGIGDLGQTVKDAAGPGLGGLAGSAIGGGIPLALGQPELVPAGAYLGSIVGSAGGQGISDLLRSGQVDVPAMGRAGAWDAVLGPIFNGASAGIQGFARKMGGGDLIKQAAGSTVDMGPVAAEASRMAGKTPPYVPANRQNVSESLMNLINDLYSSRIPGANNPYETSVANADRIRAMIGDLMNTGATKDIGSQLYGVMSRDLRDQALGNTPGAQAILQKINEQKAMDAILAGAGKLPLAGSTIGGGLGAYAAYRMLNNPVQGAAALGLGLTLPPALTMGRGLFKAGMESMNPYLGYGAAPAIGESLYQDTIGRK